MQKVPHSETKCPKFTAAKSLFSLFSSLTCLVCLKNPEKSDWKIQTHSSNILLLLNLFLWHWCHFFFLAKHCSCKINLAYDGSSVSTRVGWVCTSFVTEIEKKDGTFAYEQCSKICTIWENYYVFVWKRDVVPSGWTAPFDYYNQSFKQRVI